jgi:glycosyltransferase involved in cell wall biosynthesis
VANDSLKTPIAVLLSRFPSVTETFILREIIEMERQGQPVRLAPMLRESPPVIHEAAKPWIERALYTPFLDGRILLANARALLRNPARYLWLLARLIGGTINAPNVLVRTLAVFPKSVFLAQVLEREGVRHIHAHYATHPSTMALIMVALSKMTFSFTVHAHDIQVNRALLRWKLRETEFVRSISAFNKKFLEGLYPDESRGKIDVIHVGIETHVYGADPPTTNKIVCVAAHKPYKGLPYLIEACRILRHEGLDVACDIIGEGPMHDQLAAMIRQRDLPNVRLTGPRTEEEVARMMAEASLFVLPSIVAPDGQTEGIPVSLMEAMAAGRAVVSTTVSGIPELVEHGVSGLLVPPNDARALAGAIRELLSDPMRARRMGELGREKVRAEFTLSECVRRLNARLEAFR